MVGRKRDQTHKSKASKRRIRYVWWEGEEGKEEGEERSERGGTYCNTRTVLFPIPLVASLSALTSAALALSSLCLLFSLLSSSRLPVPPLLALLSVVPINWHNDRIRRERDEKRGEKIPACMGLLLVVTQEKSCAVDYEFPNSELGNS